MGMKDCLPEDPMFPKDSWSIVLGEKLLYFALQCQQNIPLVLAKIDSFHSNDLRRFV